MPTTSNFGWTTPADTDLVKDGAAAIRTLGNGVDASFVDLKGGTTGQVLTKASETDLDFSWTAVDPLVILDAKGDLISATAADTPARLPVGANETRLVADSGESLGLKYVADTTNYAIAAKADLLVGTAADTLAALTVGTNGQVLTADSTVSPTGLKWATPAVASSGLVFINRSTFSNVASHTIDSVFSSTYASYLVAIEKLYSATAADDLLLRFRYGSSTEAGSSYYANAISAVYSSASVSNYASSGTTSMALTSTGGDSGNPCAGLLEFNCVGNASEVPLVTGNILDAQEIRVFNVGGGTITAQTYTGFQLFAASGNITGAVSVYGLATS